MSGLPPSRRSATSTGAATPHVTTADLRALLGKAGIETPRLRLRPAHWPQVEAMEWLPAALAPDWRLDDLRSAVERGDAALVQREAKDIGLIVVTAGVPEANTAAFRFIAIEPGERFRGLGGEAALGLERRLREAAGVERFLAAVPEQRGLAVYFWLRLGYRPLVQALAPWPVVGLAGEDMPGIWMSRGPVQAG